MAAGETTSTYDRPEMRLVAGETTYDRAAMRLVADEAAEITVTRMLLAMGINSDNNANILEMQADIRFLREWRLSTTKIRLRAMLAVTAVLLSGTFAAIWIGFKEILHR